MYFLFKKIITTGVLISILALNLNTFKAYADTPESTIKENKVKYQELNNQIMELNSKIVALDVEIEKINTNLEENKNEISSIELKITSTESELEQTKEDIEESQIILDNRIRSMYKTNMSSNILLSVLTSTSLSDLVSRVQSISKIVSVDKEIISDITAKKEKLNETIEELNVQEKNLQTLQLSIKEDLNTLEEKQTSQEDYLIELNKEKDNVFEIIESNETQLISHPLSIINSSSSASEIQNAIDTLDSLIPQLNSEKVIGQAQDAIYNGTLKIEELNTPIIETPVNDNNIGTSKKSFTMQSTAYTGGSFTAMGLKPVRNPDGISTIAVDPSIIPLGSKVYVSNYGVAIASDTGGAIKGNIIDLYFNSYSECIQWGRRSVTVDILAYPGEW